MQKAILLDGIAFLYVTDIDIVVHFGFPNAGKGDLRGFPVSIPECKKL